MSCSGENGWDQGKDVLPSFRVSVPVLAHYVEKEIEYSKKEIHFAYTRPCSLRGSAGGAFVARADGLFRPSELTSFERCGH
jgi:hypothetical protein